jgi:hypothetical protein
MRFWNRRLELDSNELTEKQRWLKNILLKRPNPIIACILPRKSAQKIPVSFGKSFGVILASRGKRQARGKVWGIPASRTKEHHFLEELIPRYSQMKGS